MNSQHQPIGNDWPERAADTVERVVETIRTRTIDPLEHLARVIVYGIAAAILGISIATFVIIALVRFIDIWIPGSVWGAHLLTGGIFFLLGLFCWSRRFASESTRNT